MSSNIRLPHTPSPAKAATEWTKGFAEELQKAAGDSGRMTPKKAETITGMYADNVKNYFDKTGRKWVKVDTLLDSAQRYAERELNQAAGPDNKLSLKDIRLLPKDMVDDLLIMRGQEPIGVGAQTGTPPHNDVAALNAAVKAADATDLSEYGVDFGVDNYARGTDIETIIRDFAGMEDDDISRDDLLSWYSFTDGAAGVEAFAKLLRKTGAEEFDSRDGDDDYQSSGTVVKKVYDDIADQVQQLFLNAENFTNVQFANHSIAEDGDLEVNVLIGTRTDGSMLAVGRSNFPF